MSELEVKTGAQALIDDLEGNGAYVHIARADRDYAITTGLRSWFSITSSKRPAAFAGRTRTNG